MVSIDLEHFCLLELIKASLFDLHPNIPKDADWKLIFESAKIQCIVPLVAPRVPQEYRNEWNGISFQSKAYYMQMIYEQNMLYRLFMDNNIPFVILKGTSAAIYYPNPQLRTFGDIDFLVSEDYLVSARTVMDTNGYIYISNDDRHYEFAKNGFIFELHSKFSCDRYNDIDHMVVHGLDNAVEYKIGTASFPGLPTYDNGLVLLGHIMQHLKSLGIGLRQIIDWMMFVYNELDDTAWENSFKSIAKEAGLEKLAKTVTLMCKKWLGLPDTITWCDDADDEIADQLLIRILDDGNFGQDRAPFEIVKKTIKEGGFKYLQSAGLENWPLAQKHAMFRPFAWLYQLFKYLFTGIACLFAGKKLFMKDKHKMSLEDLFNKLI